MAGTIFRDTLSNNWRQILYWGIGLGFLGLFMVVALPDVEALEQYALMVESLPPALLELVGVSDAEVIATPEGFMAFGFFGYGIIVLAVFAVLAGMSVTANEEDEGLLDVVLSLPVPRWRVMVERLLAYAIITIGVIAISFVPPWIGLQFSSLEIDVSRMIVSMVNLVPASLLMLVVTVFLSVVVRRKGMASAIVTAFIIASYFLDFIGGAASGQAADILGGLSFFTYVDTESVMFNGLNYANVALLLGIALVLGIGSVWAFERRDIGL